MPERSVHGFFESFYLNGLNESTLIKTEDGISKVNTRTPSNTLMTMIEYKNKTFPDGDVGFYNNDQFSKFLSLFNSDKLNLSFDKKNDQHIKAKLSGNDKLSVDYYLADPSIFPIEKVIKQLNNWEINLKLTGEETTNFLKARNALSTATLLYVGKDIFIGNEEYGSNRITINISDYTNEIGMDEYLKFNLDDVKSVIGVLQEGITIKVSSLGLMEISWQRDNLSCKYYLTQIVSD
jgi:hypothetical protein